MKTLLYQDIKEQKVGIIAVMLYYLSTRFLLPISCPFVFVSGLPCPGCGLTRAGIAVLTGQFYRAFELNFFIYPIIVLVFIFCFYRYILRRKAKYLTWAAVAVVILLLAYYVFRMITVFPGDPPMSFYQNNLLQRFIN